MSALAEVPAGYKNKDTEEGKRKVQRNLSLGYYDLEPSQQPIDKPGCPIDTISRRVYKGEPYVEINGANIYAYSGEPESNVVIKIRSWAKQEGIAMEIPANSTSSGTEQYHGRILLKTGDVTRVTEMLREKQLISRHFMDFIKEQEAVPGGLKYTIETTRHNIGQNLHPHVSSEQIAQIFTGENKETDGPAAKAANQLSVDAQTTAGKGGWTSQKKPIPTPSIISDPRTNLTFKVERKDDEVVLFIKLPHDEAERAALLKKLDPNGKFAGQDTPDADGFLDITTFTPKEIIDRDVRVWTVEERLSNLNSLGIDVMESTRTRLRFALENAAKGTGTPS